MKLIVSLVAVSLVLMVVSTTAQKHRKHDTEVRLALRVAKYGLKTPQCPASGGGGGNTFTKYTGKNGNGAQDRDYHNTRIAITAAQSLYPSDDVVAELTKGIFYCRHSYVNCGTNKPKYRTMDGSCNNWDHPKWGMAGSPQKRLVPAAYDDGISEPRSRGVNGDPLPNPRTISNSVHAANEGDPELTSPILTLHAFQMGQFVDHDVILTKSDATVDNCCECNDTFECMPIRVPDGDPHFPSGYCFDFKRSIPYFCGGLREQKNSITSYVDASNVYGSSDEELRNLRKPGTPFLKTSPGKMLPFSPDQSSCLSDIPRGYKCGLGGDIRVHTVPSLATYHTMFVREHNRIAEALAEITSADDETVFQETRKILIAIMQKIVYDEFLASFLSSAAMSKYKLSSDEAYQYIASMDASIFNAFGITFRMGHSWIPRFLKLETPDFEVNATFGTEETYNKPDVTYFDNGMDGLALGLSGSKSGKADRIVDEVARSLLFTDGIDSLDLAAANIGRGRDHGLAPYNEYRKWCQLTALTDWNSAIATNAFDFDTRDRLQQAGYQSPRDIDLFTGVVSETPVGGGVLGPVGECIIGSQFQAIKWGDSYWYQGDDVGFTPAQVTEIRKSSLARLLCDHFEFKTVNYPNAFLQSNTKLRCESIHKMNLNVFG